jgi:flavin reductase (DIM6/NTAB) family NADH-FMN oxidoreductase RutF
MDGSAVTTETAFTPGPETARLFRDALGRFATGVTVITAEGTQGPVGLTANSFAAVSLDPPLVLWSPARASRRFATFAHAPHFAIHVLAEGQEELARHFTRPDDHFAGLHMTRSPEGMPLLPGTLARFECEHAAAHEAGDHVIVVGRVLRASFTDGAPLVFSRGRYTGLAATA